MLNTQDLPRHRDPTRLEHQLIVELFWRDFYSHIAYFFLHVFGGSFHPQYNAKGWDTDPAKFSAWCAGRTGFPIVDAGMRELNATGFLHNRVRMIVASFLTKDLHIDWRWGERYFAQKLVDYDPAVNNGNWQWCASTGCDAQPYFRNCGLSRLPLSILSTRQRTRGFLAILRRSLITQGKAAVRKKLFAKSQNVCEWWAELHFNSVVPSPPLAHHIEAAS
ncbi:MAG: FAD-binding domain-containing protein [Halobacteriota archaeon]